MVDQGNAEGNQVCQSERIGLLVIGYLSENILLLLEAAGRVQIIECSRINTQSSNNVALFHETNRQCSGLTE